MIQPTRFMDGFYQPGAGTNQPQGQISYRQDEPAAFSDLR